MNLKMTVLPKLIYRVDAIPIISPAGIFTETDKLILKLILNCNRSTVAQTIFKKSKELKTHPDFKIYYKTLLINIDSVVLA